MIQSRLGFEISCLIDILPYFKSNFNKIARYEQRLLFNIHMTKKFVKPIESLKFKLNRKN